MAVVDDQLLYEARMRPRQAVIAATAGVLLVIAAVVQLAGPHTKVDELTLDLITAHKRFPLDVVGSVINALGSFGVAAALAFLYNATRARNPQVQPFIRPVAIAGGVVEGIAGVAYAILIAIKAHQFVGYSAQTYVQANHLTSGSGIQFVPLLSLFGGLLLALAYVMVSMQAMRVGLLTRFMGYLGMFAGALVLFQITAVPVVQAFWLLALAYMLSGRWPTGVPASWRSGRAEKWPSSQELREQRTKAAAGGKQKPAASPPAETVGAAASARTRATTPKRKRKRRR